MPRREGAIRIAAAKQISRAGNGRARSPSAPPSLRTWDASQESLRNYACKDAQKGNCPRTAVSPPSVYLYGLSQAPLAMHRRRFSFSAPADYKTERKPKGDEKRTCWRMKSNAVHFITSGIVACGLCLCAEAAGAKTNAVEKTVATSVAKVDAAAKTAAEAKAAAEKGGAEAQFRYAEILRDGRGVAKNMKEAAKWTRKAADAGHARAQCQMGLFYINGLGVDRDEDKAVEWLENAAKQNNALAQYNLGIYYARFSDKESVRLALKWLNEAVKQDYADAEYNLAKLYLNPHHPASKEQGAGRRAIQLLRFSAAQGHAGAKEMLEELGCSAPQPQEKSQELRQIERTTLINNVF